MCFHWMCKNRSHKTKLHCDKVLFQLHVLVFNESCFALDIQCGSFVGLMEESFVRTKMNTFFLA